ncbi:MAG: 1-phosphofructokinase family hexose kinase [Clostridia bacterium]|nr:1-phosphofructokinase family hexose kinase [Clostridia bacterium]
MNIFTLTLNPAFDIHAHLPHFAPYAENLAAVTDRDAGGKGVNISRALTANGIESFALVVVGEENGAEFCRMLEADGIVYRAFSVAGRIRENLTLYEDSAPETRISFGGLAAHISLLDAVEQYLDGQMGEGDILTMTGRLPAGLSVAAVKAFLSRMKEKGARLVIDSRSFSLSDLVDVHPWLIKPNEEEASAYLGRMVRSFADALDGARALHAQGIENVMISLGGEGALLVCPEGTYMAAPPVVSVLSTVGAGDSSIAGFLAATVGGASAADALGLAVAYGTAACVQAGTRPPKPDDIKRVGSRVTLRKI